MEGVAERAAGDRKARPPRSVQAQAHVALRRRLVHNQPAFLALAGPDPRGAWCALAILGVHWTAAWLVSGTNIAVVFLAAFFFGQITIHSAGSLIHETAHRLVFRGRRSKLAFDLLLEVITTSFGRQLVYQHEHVSSHHPHMGDYEHDYEHEDSCRFLARRRLRGTNRRLQRLLAALEILVNLLPLGFLIAGEIFPRLYGRLTGLAPKDRQRDIQASKAPRSEQYLFIAVSLATNIFLFAAFGFLGWLYQIWSLSLFLGKCGVTNLGQSHSEHPGDDDANPTRSTYWWGNWILFNTGYHHEHHTFPNVAWSRLPKVKAMAPEAFSLASERSYFRCWWDHLRSDFDLPSRRNALQRKTHNPRCSVG